MRKRTELPKMRDDERMIWLGPLVNEPYRREDLYEYKGKRYICIAIDKQISYWELDE